MSGVWVFDKKGVVRLITNPTRESFEMKPEPTQPTTATATATAPGARPRLLVYLPTNQVITSFSQLEQRLNELGWTRYYSNSHHHHHHHHHHHQCPNDIIQFHRSDASNYLLSLPRNFSSFKHFHLYDIVIQNRSFFQVRDPTS
ncbi:unnamed protein product [Lathyrus sativus]|nr:unnamed protein product [Lathyrus sativus]